MPHPDAEACHDLLGPSARSCRRAVSGERGIALPAFTDHHVHLHLFDGRGLAHHGIAAVVDLGGDPAVLDRLRAKSIPRVAYAGAFLTVPGGYPVGRAWAPAAIVREVHSASLSPGIAGGAATAVDEQAAYGASVIKVSLHAVGVPVLDGDVLAAIVTAAHRRGMPVVAHAQGPGTTERSLAHGVDVLAHAPFSERLSGPLIARSAANQAWVSTLAIHDGREREVATANLRDFAAAGGRVLYGTDLGNGPQPVGVNAAELAGLIAAGLTGGALIDALADPWPASTSTASVSTFVPGQPPRDRDEIPRWLATAQVTPTEELIHND